MDRFLVRMWDSKYKKMWTFENDGFLECVFECLKQQLAYESKLKVLENISYNHIADGRIFMQCTGLKDKNDKLIYEHDYVMINKIIYEVFWNKTKISLANILNGDIIDFVETEEMEIIGNEHEETNIRKI